MKNKIIYIYIYIYIYIPLLGTFTPAPQKEPWPCHRHGETEAPSSAGLHLRPTQGSMAKAASSASHTSVSPLPAPLARCPVGRRRNLAPGSHRCETYLERSGGPQGRGTCGGGGCAGSLRNASAVSPPSGLQNLFNQLRWGWAEGAGAAASPDAALSPQAAPRPSRAWGRPAPWRGAAIT